MNPSPGGDGAPPSSAQAAGGPVLSVVVPCYNESDNVDTLFERLESVLDALGETYEIVCVDDGSRDDTLARLAAHHERNPAIKVVGLARNFGKEIALTAGIDHAVGQAVVPIDADLQDPPEVIGQLVARWRDGFDVVYARRRSRQGESWVKRATANLFYRVIDRVSEVPIPRDTGDFRLMDRRVVEALKRLPERTRFMKGLFAWVGYRQTAIEYDRDPRLRGQTTWNYWRLWNFALEGITSFSTVPLRVWSYVGVLVSLVALGLAGVLVIRGTDPDAPGYASLMVAVLFLGGVQLISLGVLGEYLGRIYREVKGRPLYLVRDRWGTEEAGDVAPQAGGANLFSPAEVQRD
jgi:glycosyltransferase involved in cell wall biosynthesis